MKKKSIFNELAEYLKCSASSLYHLRKAQPLKFELLLKGYEVVKKDKNED